MTQRLHFLLLTTLAGLFSPLQSVFFNNVLTSATPHHAIAHKGSTISENNDPPFRIKTVVIDAGHGGHDPGCSGADSQEKHIALAIAKKLATQIEAAHPTVQVILTRDKDVFIPLHQRAAIANKAHADLFISIHCNAMPAPGPTSGSETYVMGLHTADHNLKVAKRENDAILLEDNYERNYDYDPNSPEGHILLSMFQHAYMEQSIQFAERVEHHFQVTAKRKSRGVKQAGFVVLKETAMPSVLVETGFLSSTTDEAFLNTAAGQDAVALALLNAFTEYKNKLETGDAPVAAKAAANTPTPVAVATPTPPNTTPPPAANTQAKGIVAQEPAKETVKIASAPTTNSSAAPAVLPEPMVAIIPTQSTHATNQPATNRAAQPQSSETNTAWAEKIGQPGLIFCIQLAATPRPLDTNQAPWKGSGYLIEVVQEEGLYKYQVRNMNLHQAMEARIALQQKGFTDAFLVPYHQGKKIPMAEARKLMGE
ncbi:MAG: N-acetylmuramoyl-L-alanine amidase [Saprospiraceae bacterium]